MEAEKKLEESIKSKQKKIEELNRLNQLDQDKTVDEIVDLDSTKKPSVKFDTTINIQIIVNINISSTERN